MNAAIRIIAWILAVALVALPVVAVLQGWIAGERWPMRRLVVHGEFQRVGAEQIRSAVLPHADRGFFAVDLDGVRRAVAALPWVERVEVRKRWPDRIEIAVSEHRPFARWGEDRLLSEHGRLFAAPGGTGLPEGLPALAGPDARLAEVVALYNRALPLFAGTGRRVDGVSLSPRGSWTLTLDGGAEIIVGRDDAQPRIERFARLLSQIVAAERRRLLRADLRYTNGFALTWQPAEPAAPGSGHPPPSPPSPASGGRSSAQANT